MAEEFGIFTKAWFITVVSLVYFRRGLLVVVVFEAAADTTAAIKEFILVKILSPYLSRCEKILEAQSRSCFFFKELGWKL